MIPIFDNGHGGIIGGEYMTPGKRTPAHMGEPQIFEGAWNRWLVNRCIEELNRQRMSLFHVSDSLEDLPLSERVKKANIIHTLYPNTYLLSVHANAGGGEGIEVFTSPGQTKSDQIAEHFMDVFMRHKLHDIYRLDQSDGDKDKEAKFYVLTKTKCPAILVEYGFMDNENDRRRLNSIKYLESCVNATVDAICSLTLR